MTILLVQKVTEGLQVAADGGQALHIHDMTQDGHPFFKRFKQAGHLFDLNSRRLMATASRLGVKCIVVHHQGKPGQHVDLCGGPLRRALAESVKNPV